MTMRRVGKIALGVLGALALVVAVFVAATWAPDRPVDALKPRWAQPSASTSPASV